MMKMMKILPEEKSDEDTEKDENYVKKEPSIGTRLFLFYNIFL